MAHKYPGTLVVSTEKAKELADPYCRFDKNYDLKPPAKTDPFSKEIEASLLSAVEIKTYVEETGMIAPFYVGAGKDSLLKEAAYEGRIGNKAFKFDDNGELESLLNENSKVLLIPGDSIVFVECDLEFRVPEFIALRFNLQIKHVHRGLLLGTGPLIDPGFWGKLCIPLHNLTDSDYEIALDEGLIWIEFTRITANYTDGQDRLGRPPLGEPFWEIDKFIKKAARDHRGDIVPIRSSIPVAARAAGKDAERAAREAKDARKGADIANENAEKAKDHLYSIGIGAGLAGLIAICALLFALYSIVPGYTTATQNKLDAIEPKIRDLEVELSRHLSQVEQFESSETRRQAQNQVLSASLSAIQETQRTILKRLNELEAGLPGNDEPSE